MVAPCPRCGCENPPTARSCTRCRTPLALGEEPLPGRLDVLLDLDRRRERAPQLEKPPPRASPSGEAAPPFEPDRSDWELGAPVDASVDPEVEPGPATEAWEEPDAGDDPGPLRPASPIRRAAAWAIDGGLLVGAAVGLPAVLLATNGAIGRAGSLAGAFAEGLSIVVPSVGFVAVAGFVYATVAHSLAGATLGKQLVGIRVVGSDGRSPGPACSAIRSGWLLLSVALAGAGLLPALLTPSRRALHDLLAGTRVVEPP